MNYNRNVSLSIIISQLSSRSLIIVTCFIVRTHFADFINISMQFFLKNAFVRVRQPSKLFFSFRHHKFLLFVLVNSHPFFSMDIIYMSEEKI